MFLLPYMILNMTLTVLANDGKWVFKANMPTPRKNFSISVVNGKIYAIGGERDNVELSAVEEYDPKLDRWTTGTDLN